MDSAFHRLSEELLTLIVDAVAESDASEQDSPASAEPQFWSSDTLKALRLTHSCFAYLARLQKLLFVDVSFFPDPRYRKDPARILACGFAQHIETVTFGSFEKFSNHDMPAVEDLSEGELEEISKLPQVRTWFDSGALTQEWTEGLALLHNVHHVAIENEWIEPLQHTKPAKDGGIFNLALQCCVDVGIRPVEVTVYDPEGRCNWASRWWEDLDVSRLEQLYLAGHHIPESVLCKTFAKCAHSLRRLTFGDGCQIQLWKNGSQFAQMPALRELVMTEMTFVVPATVALLIALSPQLEHLEMRNDVPIEQWQPVFSAIREHKTGMAVMLGRVGADEEDEDGEPSNGEGVIDDSDIDDEEEAISYVSINYHTTAHVYKLEGLGPSEDGSYTDDLCRYMSNFDETTLRLPWNGSEKEKDPDESE